MKLAVINTRNSRAQADEALIMAYAEGPGRPWKAAKTLSFGADWRQEDTILVNFTHASGLVSHGRKGGKLAIPGFMPLILAVSHPWSGVIDLRTGPWATTFDLHHPETRVVLIDVTNSVVIEVDPGKYFNDGQPMGTAPDPISLIPPTLAAGRPVHPLVFPTRALRSLRGRRLIPTVMSHLFAKSPSRMVMSAILEGLIGMSAGTARSGPAKIPAHANDQFILLTAAVEGLSRRVRNV